MEYNATPKEFASRDVEKMATHWLGTFLISSFRNLDISYYLTVKLIIV